MCSCNKGMIQINSLKSFCPNCGYEETYFSEDKFDELLDPAPEVEYSETEDTEEDLVLSRYYANGPFNY